MSRETNGQAMRAPARVRIVGSVLALLGGLTLIGALADTETSRAVVAWNVAAGGIAFISGAALVGARRWALPIGVLLSAGMVMLGVYTMLQPSDVTVPGAFVVAFILLVVPGAIFAIALLSGRSRRWFRAR